MRAINFNAGPAGLPLPALERARDELIDFKGSGMSILEHSHRGKEYEAVHDEAIALLTRLLGIPDTHQVLFLQGGASLQFAMVPMNFLPKDGSADYILTGTWSEKALDEAKILGTPRVAATTIGPDKRYTRIPRQAELQLDPNAAYVHLTSNNTIFGTQWHAWPQVGTVPLVADMSSDFLWRPTDVSRFGLIYAGAQKNLGPSGVTVVIAPQGPHGSGTERHPEDPSLRDPRREQLALQHAAHLRDLPDAQRAGLDRGAGRAGRAWSGATPRRPSSSTRRSTG